MSHSAWAPRHAPRAARPPGREGTAADGWRWLGGTAILVALILAETEGLEGAAVDFLLAAWVVFALRAAYLLPALHARLGRLPLIVRGLLLAAAAVAATLYALPLATLALVLLFVVGGLLTAEALADIAGGASRMGSTRASRAGSAFVAVACFGAGGVQWWYGKQALAALPRTLGDAYGASTMGLLAAGSLLVVWSLLHAPATGHAIAFALFAYLISAFAGFALASAVVAADQHELPLATLVLAAVKFIRVLVEGHEKAQEHPSLFSAASLEQIFNVVLFSLLLGALAVEQDLLVSGRVLMLVKAATIVGLALGAIALPLQRWRGPAAAPASNPRTFQEARTLE